MRVPDAYDRWAQTYDEDQNATRDLDALVLRESGLELDGRDVVELGCGTGKNTVWLAEYARSLIALDFSEQMIERARKRVQLPVRFIKHDVREPWPLDSASADVIVGNLILEHVEDMHPVFAEVARVLCAGGVAFLAELHPDRQQRGSQAQFTDVETGERVFVEAYVHTIAEFEAAAHAARLQFDLFSAHVESAAPADAPPRILAMRFRRDA